ncbi:MAG: outer membrane lipoprotein chaperone LolA [Vicinamibacterales bacterium]
MSRCSLLAACIWFLGSFDVGMVGEAGQQTAQQVASALQAKYDRVRDFTAEFTQQYESGILRKKLTERGKVQVKKPGRMRWDYSVPDKKVFVSDGSRVYLWVPADNQVTISSVPKQDEATTAVLFLVGKGDLTRDFTVNFTANAPPDRFGLRLQPKLPERDFDWLELVIDRTSLQIRTLAAGDRQGGQSTFTFANFKENRGLTDKTFEFKIPRGADVINAGAPSR